MGRVSIVGAGPGDPGLITAKGLERLRTCDAVLYDHLVDERLLTYVKKDCRKIETGKRAGGHSAAQQEINALMISLAGEYPLVVRLKGGDPFVFGRGFEECEALRGAGISYEVIPGLTSAAAAAESAGLPLTHRGLSRSFHVVTAHRKDGEPIPEAELRDLAAVEGTLIFLMAVRRLEEITEGLVRNGKAPHTPASVIENGSLPGQRRIDGTLSDIAARAREAGVISPSVLVIGETAVLDFRDPSERRRVLTLGTEETAGRFADAAADVGIEVCPLQTLRPLLTPEYESLVRACGHIGTYDWIVFFSRQAVNIFRRSFAEAGADLRELSACRFAVNSPSAGKVLQEWGIRPDYVAERPDAASFAEGFLAKFTDDTKACGDPASARVLIPRALHGSSLPAQQLREAGLRAAEIRAYDIAPAEDAAANPSDLQDELRRADAIALFSASGAHALADLLTRNALALPPELPCYCIGPYARTALLNHFPKQPTLLAPEPTLAGLVKALSETLR